MAPAPWYPKIQLLIGADRRNAGKRKIRYASGHHSNVFQARFMEGGDSTLVSCAADGPHSVAGEQARAARLQHAAIAAVA